MEHQKYALLKQESSNGSKEDLLDAGEQFALRQHQASLRRAWLVAYSVLVMLGLSLAINALLWTQLRIAQQEPRGDPSFVGLQRNIVKEIPHDDRTIDDPMWEDPEWDWYSGWVALDNDWAVEKGAPTSMHWPWDDSKGIYVFHSFHSLHCVFVLRESIMQFRDGVQQVWAFEHVTHCLHVLREDTVCNADDTPRYTGHLHAQANSSVVSSGLGQQRMCRDWNQLREFSLANSACYRRPLDHYIPLLDRYKSCPNGQTPWEGVQA